MTKKLVIIVLVLLVCFVGVLVYQMRPVIRRLDILSDYQQLLADPDAAGRLAFVPEIKHWESAWPKDSISIGYANFIFPFGDIQHIRETSTRVSIESDQTEVSFVLYQSKDFAGGWGRSTDKLPGLTYAGGEIKPRDEKYLKHDSDLVEITSGVPSYAFFKTLYELKPKPVLSLLFVDFGYLYLYEKLLEMKNAQLCGGDVFLFETDTLKGKVERLDWVEEGKDYSSCHVISVWNAENTLYQLIQVKSHADEITEQDIQRFISSLSYQTYTIELNSENLRPIILEALEQNAYYVRP